MIRRISISNYALISDLTLSPAPGFNIITGETGAGKSIILGAIGLLMGKRVDIKDILASGNKSFVELEAVLADGSVSILRREILPSGRSKAFIDDKPVSLSNLADLTASIIDIHSQHQNLLLADPAFQLTVLDSMARNADLRQEYKKVYGEYRSALQKFVTTRDEIERTRSDADFLEYQLAEFEGLDLRQGEDDDLENLRKRIAKSAELADTVAAAHNILSGAGDNSVIELMAKVSGLSSKIAEIYPEQQEIHDKAVHIEELLQSLADDIDDIPSDIDDYDVYSPEEIEDKISRINILKSKHRVNDINGLIAFRESIMSRLEGLHNAEITLHNLEKDARRLKKQALELASAISESRRAAASLLEKELTDRARPLGMENLVFKIGISTGKLNPDGIDSVEFLFAFNKNQEPRPVGNRASGGEISRVMLALKSITVEHGNTPTIIFDEIDTGVSGDVANRMGRLMEIISRHIQVIAITHLPQIAARGDKHFKVYKLDDDTSTHTHLTVLDAAGRRAELATMLSGNPDDETSLATADMLLSQKS